MELFVGDGKEGIRRAAGVRAYKLWFSYGFRVGCMGSMPCKLIWSGYPKVAGWTFVTVVDGWLASLGACLHLWDTNLESRKSNLGDFLQHFVLPNQQNGLANTNATCRTRRETSFHSQLGCFEVLDPLGCQPKQFSFCSFVYVRPVFRFQSYWQLKLLTSGTRKLFVAASSHADFFCPLYLWSC